MEKTRKKNNRVGSIGSIFMHADGVDLLYMVLGLIGAVGDGLTMPLMFVVTSKFMNDIGARDSFISPDEFSRSVNKKVIFICIIAAGAAIVNFLEGYCWTRTAERQTSRMRLSYLKAVLRQDVGFFEVQVASSFEVVNNVSSDSLTIQEVISEKVPHFVMNMSNFIGSYVTTYLVIWRLALVGMPFVLLLIIPGLMYGKISIGLARKVSIEYNKAGSIAEQAIASIRTVYAFVGESKTMSKFSDILKESMKLGLKQGLAKGIAVGSNGVTFMIWAFNAWYGSNLVMDYGAKGGTVYIMVLNLLVGGLALGTSLSDIKSFSEAASAGERIMEMIHRVPNIDTENMDDPTIEHVSGEIEFKHVKFAYPTRPNSIIFQDFSLHIPAKKTVALVGQSGSGKSTSIALLQRFYDPIAGEILLDGVAIHKLQLKWLRSHMALVSQEPALFATSIKENILFGKEEATMEEVIQAAKASNAHNFITRLPQGYDTQVGERGVQMSGGQKQRIAIARAIIRKPCILLLDEATSALDTESERVVQEALDNAIVGRTTITIAHRLSTIRNADIIAVVENGQVMELGSHDDLIIRHENGIYNSLLNLQQINQTQDQAMSVSNISTPTSSIFEEIITSSCSSSKATTPLVSDDGSSLVKELPSEVKGEDNDKVPVPSFRRLLALSKPEWKQASLGCVGAILFGAIQPVCAVVLAMTLSAYFLQDHDEMKKKIRIYALCFLGFGVFSFVTSIVQHYNFAYMGENLTKRVREQFLSKILSFEIGWFDQDQNGTGTICSRLSKDANVVRSLVADRICLLVQATSAVVIAFTMGLIINWRLAIVMIAVQPVLIFCFYMRRVLLKDKSKKITKSQDESSKLASEAIGNFRTIAAFSSQDKILTMLKKLQLEPRKESIRQSWYAGIGLAAAQVVNISTRAFNFWYGGMLLSRNYLTPIELFEIFIILLSTGRVIAEAGTMTTDIAKGADAVGSLFAILDRCTKIEPDDGNGYKPNEVFGHIEFQNVDFSYPARPNVMIFKGFSLNIEAGKSTALVGQSGSGKSTIINLIARFYDPLGGNVFIDGFELKTYNLRSLRQHIALVSQEPTLFAGTIKENVTYGARDDVEESEIIKASKAANAYEFISGLKDGYDTFCGDRGVQLSGGQKQRIAIARAILRNPAILLLDEATSALDSQSEKLVQDALERVMVGRTSVVVAHRLSTIQHCDQIAVLDNGKLVEKGNHSSLLAIGPGGAYHSLVNIQRAPSI